MSARTEAQQVAARLHEDTAQTLSFLLVQLATCERLDTLGDVRAGLADLRQTAREQWARSWTSPGS
jgi:nitrate/nitrite-specific signal transduction histidine kinase